MGKRLSALLLSLVLVASVVSARGVLLESPQEDTGMPLFPRRAGAFYTAAYGLEGLRVSVYYSDRELDLPEFSGTEDCGGYTLNHIDDEDFHVRYLSIEGEHVFFLWERGARAELDLCTYVPSFAERYEFFAESFPDDMATRLPAVIEE